MLRKLADAEKFKCYRAEFKSFPARQVTFERVRTIGIQEKSLQHLSGACYSTWREKKQHKF